jgi:membrane protease YdiL (CAAX protease family)
MGGAVASAEPPADHPGAGGGLREPLLAFLAATALASVLYWAGRSVRVLGENLHGAIALIFLFAPRLAATLSGRPFDYREAGLRVEPVRLNAAVLGLALVVAWPLFLGVFLVFYGGLCSLVNDPVLGYWADWMAGSCGRWLGRDQLALRLPTDFPLLALTQVVVIALPEEVFFRGYLYGRLEERWPSTRRLLGAPVGRTLLVTSALFALGHVLVDFNVQRLVVFFPALVFGWMRARTGSVAAGALFHALCNLYSDVLHTSFFRQGPM